ncbi:MAG: putative permease, DMT superfamily [uncultured archaeon A07HB70]|nr:MAG: putative permease, DMT superfamily [uncultured archaeon A07HB70]
MSRLRDAALFVLLGLVWGGGFPATEVGLTAVSPLALAALRYYVGGGLLVLALAALRGRDVLPTGPGDGAAVVAGGVLLMGGNAVLFLGQQLVTGGVASILFALIPVLTAAGGSLFLDDGVPDAVELAGVALGVGGVALVASPGSPGATPRGAGLVVVAVVAVAAGNVAVERAAPASDGVVVAGWAMLLGAPLVHASARLAGERLTVVAGATPAALGALLFLGVVASALAYTVYFGLIRRVGAFRVSLVSYVVPVVATVVGVVALAEPVGPSAPAGFLLVLGGFALVERESIRDLL